MTIPEEPATGRYRKMLPSLLASFVLGCSFALTVIEFWSQPLALYAPTPISKFPLAYGVSRGMGGVSLSSSNATRITAVANKRTSTKPIAKTYDPNWLVASKSTQVAVTIIPKVMCSSIRSVMNNMECKNPDDRCAEARRNGNLKKLPMLQNYTRVIFFRDPLERAISTYKNSETNRYIEVPGCQQWRLCTLDYWVDRLVDVRSFKNEHFLPQTVIAQRDKMHYHYHFRMSNTDHIDFFFRELLGKAPVEKNKSSNSVAASSNNNTAAEEEDAASRQRQQMAKKFEQLSEHALIHLLLLYEEDFLLWESMLVSSPRGPGEYTMYDYYKKYMEEEFREKVAQARLSFQRSW